MYIYICVCVCACTYVRSVVERVTQRACMQMKLEQTIWMLSCGWSVGHAHNIAVVSFEGVFAHKKVTSLVTPQLCSGVTRAGQDLIHYPTHSAHLLLGIAQWPKP